MADNHRAYRSKPIEREEWLEDRHRIEFLRTELARRKVDLEPMSYGAPDLLFPRGMKEGAWDGAKMGIVREPLDYEETQEQYEGRQDQAIYNLVTQYLFIVKDDAIISILLIPKMANILASLFYGRVVKLILWGPRGGGKSLGAAIFMWISFVYLKRSCINMGGAGNQARRVYDYTKQFWHNFPGMQAGMLKREPLLQSSELKNGSQLTCATSVTTAIGEHVGLFVADECSTDRPGADHDLLRAMQGAMSEPDHRIFLLSTFHLPTGFFADCVLPGEPVLTSEGWAPVEDVVSGSLVLGVDGDFHKVRAAWSKPISDDEIRIIPRGYGAGIRVTSRHWICVVAGGGPSWRPAGEIKRGDWLYTPRPQRKRGLSSIFLSDKVRVTEVVLGPDFYRWLGYWLGDGSNSRRLVTFGKTASLTSLLDDYRALIERVFGRRVTTTSVSRGDFQEFSELSFGHVSLAAWLNEHCRAHDRQKRLPLWLLERATDQDLEQLLIGLLRTDGNLEPTKLMFRTTSASLAAGVYYISLRLGLSPGLLKSKTPDTKVVLGRTCNQRDVWALWWCGGSVSGLVLSAFNEHRTWGPERGVRVTTDAIMVRVSRTIRSPYNGPVWDLSVEGAQSFAMPWSVAHNTWDNAAAMGFTRMVWDCFDIMEPCKAGLEHATKEDPKAIESFCKKSCSLSWTRDVLDEFGNVKGQEWVGCLGKARDSQGWQTREQVLDEQRINIGTRVFVTEHACIRPYSEGQIYNPALVDACIVPFFNLRLDRPLVVGIDWGLTQCAVILIGEWTEGTLGNDDYREGIGVVDVVYMSNRLTQAVVDQIRRWQERFGELKHKHLGDPNGVEIIVRADGSHPYCNREVATNGYRVKPVFGDRKLLGEDNMSRWFGSGLFKIVEGFGLFVTQLHNLKRNTSTGKQVKKNLEGEEGDHGPDACKFAVMNYDFVKMLHKREKTISEAKKAKQRKLPNAKRGRGGLDSLLM